VAFREGRNDIISFFKAVAHSYSTSVLETIPDGDGQYDEQDGEQDGDGMRGSTDNVRRNPVQNSVSVTPRRLRDLPVRGRAAAQTIGLGDPPSVALQRHRESVLCVSCLLFFFFLSL